MATDHMTSHDSTNTAERPFTTDIDQNAPISPLLGHCGAVYSTCFDGRAGYLLSSSEDCTIRLWDVDSRSCAVCYHGHQYPVWNVAFRYVNHHVCMIVHNSADFFDVNANLTEAGISQQEMSCSSYCNTLSIHPVMVCLVLVL